MKFFSVSFVFLKKKILFIFILSFVVGCNELSDNGVMSDDRNFPTRTLKNAQIIFKDSGFIKIDLIAPLIEEYGMIDTPYTLFPKGLSLNFFNKRIDSPGFLKADWVKMNDMKGIYEGRGNVVVISEKGDTLKTEKLFWKKNERMIFTQDTVFIISKTGDSIQANKGLEAKDDLSEYTLFNNQGVKFYKEGKL